MKQGNGQKRLISGTVCVLPLPWSRRWKLTAAVIVCLLELRLAAEPAQTVGETALRKAFCSWALIDLARAIARESRPHIAKALVKSHLALYGSLYSFSETHGLLSRGPSSRTRHQGLTPDSLTPESPTCESPTYESLTYESLKTLDLLLTALASATHELLGSPKTPEEWGAQVVIDETVALWEPIRASLLPAPGTRKP